MAIKWRFPLVFLSLVLAVNGAEADVPAIFILGDSTADVGTNNFLPSSMSRADFPYNGIDFSNSTPTGRFSNGLNTADFLANLLGYEESPKPFLSLNSSSLFKWFGGFSFASGGSGIFDTTGQRINKNCIPLAEQIQQFSLVRSNLSALMGPVATETYLSKSLFFISIGSNDMFEYYSSNSSIPKEQFLSSLVATYENHLKTLLNLGARKLGIISVAPIGCCPSLRVLNATGGCIEELNDHAKAFHSKLAVLMNKLSSEFEGLKYSLGNAFEMTINVIQNPLAFNFTQVDTACCGTGKLNAENFCKPDANLCTNRDQYLFWDRFHPTQAAYKLAAVTLYGGGPQFVTPINFAQLAKA
ncbi:GDSL esterase/lipase At5g55050-like [Argentina anserina]|uniref:GDSL esterase/lipase At5g55050-like n=1 Tax=Argentina anserina TaxID=57926 RepID=UPI0021764677|nr:GDSL esterase/lipase At5g55050-like [Potentilla anserina]